MRNLLTTEVRTGLVCMLVGCGGGEPIDEPTPQETTAAPPMAPVSIVFSGPVGEGTELFSLDLADGSRNQLTVVPGTLAFPVWSPADDRIAYTMMTEESADLMVLDFVSGETSTLIANYGNLADWGPGGERLLVVRDSDEAGLYILHVADGTQERVDTGSSADAYARWARNGEAIVYESSRDGNPEVYITWLTTGETTRLTENDQLDEWPSISPDAARIAWASGTEEEKNLWVMRSDGSEKRQLATGMLFGDAFPEWSPDGSRILFTVNENDRFVLKLLDLASGELTDLGPGSAASWR